MSGERDDPRAFAAELATDLRAWLEWAELTGAIELPASASLPSAPALAPASQAGVPPPTPAPPLPPAYARSGPPAARPAPGPRTERAPSQPFARTTPRAPSPAMASSATPIAPPPTGAVAQGEAGLTQVRAELGDCQRCRLARERKNIVFGVGDPNASLLLVGEGPGQQEDLTGEPFVGRAGQLLTRMLGAIGLKREAVYICNVIKCRPPQNRDPLLDEIAACSPFLQRQISAVQPKVILTLGRFAAATVVGVEGSMGEMRKRVGSWDGIPIVSTYHPSYLLRTPHQKRAAWEDLLRVRTLLRGSPQG